MGTCPRDVQTSCLPAPVPVSSQFGGSSPPVLPGGASDREAADGSACAVPGAAAASASSAVAAVTTRVTRIKVAFLSIGLVGTPRESPVPPSPREDDN
ncbi:hypothetical protein GCM10010346_18970 [Streptomyces chryseus]|uniref:Uncharacterized protein n=1 Tax=Streptomyces chryseus TaxID=68186 RepID=A0ABQ3DK14_9ACTN|nr:hypothetical protein GCM10010346_18970 [Streptomyces chryseus]